MEKGHPVAGTPLPRLGICLDGEKLAGVLDSKPELQDRDAREGVREPMRSAVVGVVAEYRLTDAEAIGELPTGPSSEGANRVDAAQRGISVEIQVHLPWRGE